MNQSAKFTTIALIGKRQSPDAAQTVLALAQLLAARNIRVLIDPGTAATIDVGPHAVADLAEMGRVADLAIVAGGDGTLLHAARKLAPFDVPLVGINQGRLGFMTDIPRTEMAQAVAAILDGKFRAEQRMLLEAEVCRGATCEVQSLALNEVVVSKSDGGRMIEFALSIDDEFIYNQRSDGLIISTATGSTAYALSANGPILHPAVGGIALVPLCPHALTARPITVPDSARLTVTLAPRFEGRLHCDGQTGFDLLAGDVVKIARSKHRIRLLHPETYSYFAMLREKLHWSEPATPKT